MWNQLLLTILLNHRLLLKYRLDREASNMILLTLTSIWLLKKQQTANCLIKLFQINKIKNRCINLKSQIFFSTRYDNHLSEWQHLMAPLLFFAYFWPHHLQHLSVRFLRPHFMNLNFSSKDKLHFRGWWVDIKIIKCTKVVTFTKK